MVRPSQITALLAASGIATAALLPFDLAALKPSSSKFPSSSKALTTKATSTGKIIATSSTSIAKTTTSAKYNVSSRTVGSSEAASLTSASEPSVSVTSVPGCPLITVTTSTYNAYVTEYSSTITQTQPNTIVVTTRYTYVPTSYIYGTTITNTYPTKTRTVLVVPTATATVTVPTNPGFTPILCEPTYYAKTTIVSTDTYTVDSYTVKYQGKTTSTYFDGKPGPSTVTTTLSSSTAYAQYTPTITVTSTRPNPTSTVYDACATNNITPKLPSGYNAYFVTNYQNYTTGEVYTTGVQTVALNAVDCCGLCQGNSSCAASNWLPRTDPGDGSCVLYIKLLQKDQCNPQFTGAQGGVSVSDADPYAFMSNGPCGQYFLTQ